MEGLLVYNGAGDHDEWYHVFCCTPQIWYNVQEPYLYKSLDPMSDFSKPYFKVGGPKLLIKW